MNYIQKALEELGIANGERFRIKNDWFEDRVFCFKKMERASSHKGDIYVNYYSLMEGDTSMCTWVMSCVLSGELPIELIPTFTEDEKAFIRLCEGIKWVARDEIGQNLYGYDVRPERLCGEWTSNGRCVNISLFAPNLKFTSIKWADDKPWSREEILA